MKTAKMNSVRKSRSCHSQFWKKKNDSFNGNITLDYSFKGSLSEFSSHPNKILDALIILDSVFLVYDGYARLNLWETN